MGALVVYSRWVHGGAYRGVLQSRQPPDIPLAEVSLDPLLLLNRGCAFCDMIIVTEGTAEDVIRFGVALRDMSHSAVFFRKRHWQAAVVFTVNRVPQKNPPLAEARKLY